jgi:hypothetical protein
MEKPSSKWEYFEDTNVLKDDISVKALLIGNSGEEINRCRENVHIE